MGWGGLADCFSCFRTNWIHLDQTRGSFCPLASVNPEQISPVKYKNQRRERADSSCSLRDVPQPVGTLPTGINTATARLTLACDALKSLLERERSFLRDGQHAATGVFPQELAPLLRFMTTRLCSGRDRRQLTASEQLFPARRPCTICLIGQE